MARSKAQSEREEILLVIPNCPPLAEEQLASHAGFAKSSAINRIHAAFAKLVGVSASISTMRQTS